MKILLVIIISLSSFASSKIFWVLTQEPPITYSEQNEFKGYGHQILKLITEQMPNYKHQFVNAGNYARATREVKTRDQTCAIGLFKKPERLKTMIFSEHPIFYFYNIQAVFKEKEYRKQMLGNSISIEKMLKNPKYKLGLSKGRTYFEKLGEIIAQNQSQRNIVHTSQGNVAESLFNMLMADRIHYMLLYPEEAIYLAQKNNIKEPIVTIPIKENLDLGHSWIACSKTSQGKKIIVDINKAHAKARYKEDYINYYLKWISKNLHGDYRKKFKDEFLGTFK